MFDCLPSPTEICVPKEYDSYWDYSASLRRVPAARTDGPVLIEIVAIDAELAQPVAHLAQKRLEGFTVFYRLRCETLTNCRLWIGSAPADMTDTVLRRGLILREYDVSSKTGDDMNTALGKLRYCVRRQEGCSAGPSVSFAELKTPQETPR